MERAVTSPSRWFTCARSAKVSGPPRGIITAGPEPAAGQEAGKMCLLTCQAVGCMGWVGLSGCWEGTATGKVGSSTGCLGCTTGWVDGATGSVGCTTSWVDCTTSWVVCTTGGVSCMPSRVVYISSWAVPATWMVDSSAG